MMGPRHISLITLLSLPILQPYHLRASLKAIALFSTSEWLALSQFIFPIKCYLRKAFCARCVWFLPPHSSLPLSTLSSDLGDLICVVYIHKIPCSRSSNWVCPIRNPKEERRRVKSRYLFL